MNTVEYQFGNENQIGASCKVQTFVIGPDGKEHHISQAAQQLDSMNEINKSSRTAIDDQPWSVGGGWTTCNAQIADGTMFKLFISRKGQVGLPATCAIIYRVRANAPMIRLKVAGLNMRHSTTQSVTAFFGRADHISLVEAKAAGYQSKSAYERFFDSGDEDELIETIVEAAGAVAAPVQVKEMVNAETGEKTYSVKKVELRRIRRRPSSK